MDNLAAANGKMGCFKALSEEQQAVLDSVHEKLPHFLPEDQARMTSQLGLLSKQISQFQELLQVQKSLTLKFSLRQRSSSLPIDSDGTVKPSALGLEDGEAAPLSSETEAILSRIFAWNDVSYKDEIHALGHVNGCTEEQVKEFFSKMKSNVRSLMQSLQKKAPAPAAEVGGDDVLEDTVTDYGNAHERSAEGSSSVDNHVHFEKLLRLLDDNGGISQSHSTGSLIMQMQQATTIAVKSAQVHAILSTQNPNVLSKLVSSKLLDTFNAWLVAAREDKQVTFLKLLLQALRHLPVTIPVLQDSELPNNVSTLCKHPRESVSQQAVALLQRWENQETGRDTHAALDNDKLPRLGQPVALGGSRHTLKSMLGSNKPRSGTAAGGAVRPLSTDDIKRAKLKAARMRSAGQAGLGDTQRGLPAKQPRLDPASALARIMAGHKDSPNKPLERSSSLTTRVPDSTPPRLSSSHAASPCANPPQTVSPNAKVKAENTPPLSHSQAGRATPLSRHEPSTPGTRHAHDAPNSRAQQESSTPRSHHDHASVRTLHHAHSSSPSRNHHPSSPQPDPPHRPTSQPPRHPHPHQHDASSPRASSRDRDRLLGLSRAFRDQDHSHNPHQSSNFHLHNPSAHHTKPPARGPKHILLHPNPADGSLPPHEPDLVRLSMISSMDLDVPPMPPVDPVPGVIIRPPRLPCPMDGEKQVAMAAAQHPELGATLRVFFDQSWKLQKLRRRRIQERLDRAVKASMGLGAMKPSARWPMHGPPHLARQEQVGQGEDSQERSHVGSQLGQKFPRRTRESPLDPFEPPDTDPPDAPHGPPRVLPFVPSEQAEVKEQNRKIWEAGVRLPGFVFVPDEFASHPRPPPPPPPRPAQPQRITLQPPSIQAPSIALASKPAGITAPPQLPSITSAQSNSALANSQVTEYFAQLKSIARPNPGAAVSPVDPSQMQLQKQSSIQTSAATQHSLQPQLQQQSSIQLLSQQQPQQQLQQPPPLKGPTQQTPQNSVQQVHSQPPQQALQHPIFQPPSLQQPNHQHQLPPQTQSQPPAQHSINNQCQPQTQPPSILASEAPPASGANSATLKAMQLLSALKASNAVFLKGSHPQSSQSPPQPSQLQSPLNQPQQSGQLQAPAQSQMSQLLQPQHSSQLQSQLSQMLQSQASSQPPSQPSQAQLAQGPQSALPGQLQSQMSQMFQPRPGQPRSQMSQLLQQQHSGQLPAPLSIHQSNQLQIQSSQQVPQPSRLHSQSSQQLPQSSQLQSHSSQQLLQSCQLQSQSSQPHPPPTEHHAQNGQLQSQSSQQAPQQQLQQHPQLQPQFQPLQPQLQQPQPQFQQQQLQKAQPHFQQPQFRPHFPPPPPRLQQQNPQLQQQQPSSNASFPTQGPNNNLLQLQQPFLQQLHAQQQQQQQHQLFQQQQQHQLPQQHQFQQQQPQGFMHGPAGPQQNFMGGMLVQLPQQGQAPAGFGLPSNQLGLHTQPQQQGSFYWS